MRQEDIRCACVRLFHNIKSKNILVTLPALQPLNRSSLVPGVIGLLSRNGRASFYLVKFCVPLPAITASDDSLFALTFNLWQTYDSCTPLPRLLSVSFNGPVFRTHSLKHFTNLNASVTLNLRSSFACRFRSFGLLAHSLSFCFSTILVASLWDMTLIHVCCTLSVAWILSCTEG